MVSGAALGALRERWTLESGVLPPPSVEVAYRGPQPAPTRWPIVHEWDAVTCSWRRSPAPCPRRAQPETVVRIDHALAVISGMASVGDRAYLGGPAWCSTVDIEVHALAATCLDLGIEAPVQIEEGAWLSQPGDCVWGHWLIDLLPRAMSLDRVVPSGIPFIVSGDAPLVVEELLSLATSGHRPIVRMGQRGAVVRARRLWVATSARQRDAFDPAFKAVYRGLVHRANEIAESRGFSHLLLSRGTAGDSHSNRRALRDRAAVESRAEHLGYTPWAPEQFSVAEQAVTANGATRILGEGGSALLNCLFGRAGADEILLRSAVNRQTLHPLVAGLAGLNLWVIEGRPVRGASADRPHSVSDWHQSWTVDAESVSDALERLP